MNSTTQQQTTCDCGAKTTTTPSHAGWKWIDQWFGGAWWCVECLNDEEYLQSEKCEEEVVVDMTDTINESVNAVLAGFFAPRPAMEEVSAK